MKEKIKIEIEIEYNEVEYVKQSIETVGGSVNFVLKNKLPLKPDSFSIGGGDGEHNDVNVTWQITELTDLGKSINL